MFTQSGLQHGVESAARCASVNYSAKQLGLTQSCFTGVAPNAVTDSTIQQYAAQHSWGVLVPSSSSFTVRSPTDDPPAKCGTGATAVPGYVVTISSNYNLISFIFPMTLRATSCFPINVS
jgi:hypothetical protein